MSPDAQNRPADVGATGAAESKDAGETVNVAEPTVIAEGADTAEPTVVAEAAGSAEPTVVAEAADTAGPAAVSGGSGWRSIATAAVAVWAVVALVAAGWFGVGWVRAVWFTDGPRAEARDSVLEAARQAAINLSSMNPDNVDGSIDNMQSSMTGDMLDQLKQNRDRIKAAAVQSKAKVDAKVLGSALTTLDSERTKATAIVVLQLTQSAPDVPAQTFRTTWTLDMADVSGSWKAAQANSLGQLVPLDPGQQAPGAPGAPGAPAAPADSANPSAAPGAPATPDSGTPAPSASAPAPSPAPGS